jgi:cytoskeleton protein RodZ
MSAIPSDFGPMSEPEDSTGPGSQLREARHEAKYSLEEVAARLHLDRRMVRALEENDFDKLPAATFVRGYIRSYARLLSLPAGPILEAFDHQGLAPPAIIADITQHPQAKSSDIPVRLATYLVAAGLVLMVFMWWSSREAVSPAVPSTDVVANTPLQADAPPDLVIATGGDLKAPESITSSGPSDAVTADEDPPAEAASAMAAIVRPSDEAGASQTETPAAQSDTPTTVATLVPAPALETASASESATALETTPALDDSDGAAGVTEQTPVFVDAAWADIPSGHLDLRFANDSWVEVYDGSGDKLVYRLVKAGGSINLSASPPIRIILGFADGAELTLNDEPFDLEPFMRQSMARFVIGKDWTAESAWASEFRASMRAAVEPEATDTEPEAPAASPELPAAADSESTPTTSFENAPTTRFESAPSASFENAPSADPEDAPSAGSEISSETNFEAAARVQADEPAAAQFEVPAAAEDPNGVLSRH